MRTLLAMLVLLASCGQLEEESAEPCTLTAGTYAITSQVTETDCPEIFGSPGPVQDKGTVWEISAEDIAEMGFVCDARVKDDWYTIFFTGPCKCAVIYVDVYSRITADSFYLERNTELQCLPALDPDETACNKKCTASGLVWAQRLK